MDREMFKKIKSVADVRRLLVDENWLAENLPEVLALRDCVQLGPHHQEGDVLTHTRGVLENLPDSAGTALVWAGILHDIAKPQTRIERERKGEIITQFFGHDVLGADLAAKIMERFGPPVNEIERTKWLIKNHMRVFTLPEMGDKKAAEFVDYKYFSELRELFLADLAASIAREGEWEIKKKELIKTIETKIKDIKNRP